MTQGSLLVLGTSSGAGKPTVVTGLCRWLARRGVSVAPFKAQNMSLNSDVTRSEEEIGRAQAIQARAAGAEPEAAMNPVLLKPGTDTRTQLVVTGHPVSELEAGTGWQTKAGLLDLVVDAYRDPRSRYDVVACEGAGSPAEINQRATDIVNLGFARAAGVPAVLVGDIDPGGSSPRRTAIRPRTGNRCRGRTRPAIYADPTPPLAADVLRISVIRLPRASNLTDLDPLAAEPGVVIQFVTRSAQMIDSDLVVLPGSRATVSDLTWLRERGFAEALAARAAGARPLCSASVLASRCSGQRIDDTVESGIGSVDGLGLLPVHTVFGIDKVLARPERVLPDGTTVTGYEIHHGRVDAHGGIPFFADQGCRHGAAAGTTWHGLFENDAFRRAHL